MSRCDASTNRLSVGLVEFNPGDGEYLQVGDELPESRISERVRELAEVELRVSVRLASEREDGEVVLGASTETMSPVTIDV
jgi:hypothetical protein